MRFRRTTTILNIGATLVLLVDIFFWARAAWPPPAMLSASYDPVVATDLLYHALNNPASLHLIAVGLAGVAVILFTISLLLHAGDGGDDEG